MKTKIEFAEVPPVGLALLINGRRFELTGLVDHTRLDGSTTQLLAWSGFCADCGAAFNTKSPITKLPESRRCEAHRRPGVRAD